MERRKIRLADELYRISRMGMEATEILLPKVEDDELKERIARQNAEYKSFAERSKELLDKNGVGSKGEKGFSKMMLRGSTRIGTLLNRSSGHIAEMMINGSAMGIINMTKTMNRSPGGNEQAKELAGEYLAVEQKNIDGLKKHL